MTLGWFERALVAVMVANSLAALGIIPQSILPVRVTEVRAPDQRDWSLDALVLDIEKQAPNGWLVDFGEATSFNANLLTLVSNLRGDGRQWVTFCIQCPNNGMGDRDVDAFLDRVQPAAVVVKTAPYDVPRSQENAESAVRKLFQAGYVGLALPHVLPDGSRFTAYLRAPSSGSPYP